MVMVYILDCYQLPDVQTKPIFIHIRRTTLNKFIMVVNKIKAYISELKDRNENRSIAMNDSMCSAYNHTVLVHKYNTTIEIIKELEELIK
jgi:hypothetical protein